MSPDSNLPSKPRPSRYTIYLSLLSFLFVLLCAIGTYAILIAANLITPFWGIRSDIHDTSINEEASNRSLPGMLGKQVVPIEDKIIFGAHIWGDHAYYKPESPQQWNSRMNFNAASFGTFVMVHPKYGIEKKNELLDQANQVQKANGFILITLEPFHAGIDTFTPQIINKVVDVLVTINKMNVPILLRPMHEMNGNWYKWGQRPIQFKKVWIELTKAVRARTTLTSMVWSPNYAHGYPWAHLTDYTKPPKEELDALDTNGDGKFDENDDPIIPFYPGAEWVDWIGQSSLYFGPWPFGRNTLPDEEIFDEMIADILEFTKTPLARGGNQLPPKPFGIFESAISYYPNPSDNKFGNRTSIGLQRHIDMKTTWLSLLTSQRTRNMGVALAMWFEFAKLEDGKVDRDFSLIRNDSVLNAVQDIMINSVAIGAS